jgi:DnaJ domain
MKYEEACQVFEMGSDQEVDEQWIKRQYKRLSLKYHPDKNPSPEACYEFQQLHEAYMILLDDFQEDSDLEEDDQEVVYDASSGSAYTNIVWDAIYNYVLELYHTNRWNIIESMDKTVLLKLYCFLCKHRKRFSEWGDTIIYHLGLFLKFVFKPTASDGTMKPTKQYIIYPTLDDLLACNLYKHLEPDVDKAFLVPCWMEESVFDTSGCGGEILFHCIPVFPPGVSMDENRNIHKLVECSLKDVWDIPDDGALEITVGNMEIPIGKTELRMLKKQTIVRRGCGVPMGNPKDVFDVTKKSNIVIHILIL